MTFTELKTAVKDYCNLSSTEADTRIGKAINRHYRRVTSSLGLDAARFVSRNASTSAGIRTVTFLEIEKIDRVIDATDSTAIVLLTEVSLDAIRSTQPGTGQPTRWALQNTDADSVTIVLDTLPQTTYSLQADGTTTLTDLTGTDEPIFPESYHDILVWFVISEELLKKEKDKLAATYNAKASALLNDLRFYLADSPGRDTRQGAGTVMGASGSSGGAGSLGGTAYTQTALITFDRDPAAPFAVTASSAKVDNLDADKLDGFDESAFAKLADAETVSAAWTFSGIANTGLRVLDTNASHALTIKPGSDITAARTLTVTTGDADRTVTLSGNPTLNDWFDQSVKVASTPTFGATTLTGALTISGASAGQIVFPASQNASAGANTFDDYEEGNWTPVIGGSGGTSGQTYGLQIGRYVKAGKEVHVQCYVTLTAKGTITGNVELQGLPFTALNVSNAYSALKLEWFSMATNWVHISAEVTPNTTKATLEGAAAASASLGVLATADIGNTTQFIIGGTYIADA